MGLLVGTAHLRYTLHYYGSGWYSSFEVYSALLWVYSRFEVYSALLWVTLRYTLLLWVYSVDTAHLRYTLHYYGSGWYSSFEVYSPLLWVYSVGTAHLRYTLHYYGSTRLVQLI